MVVPQLPGKLHERREFRRQHFVANGSILLPTVEFLHHAATVHVSCEGAELLGRFSQWFAGPVPCMASSVRLVTVGGASWTAWPSSKGVTWPLGLKWSSPAGPAACWGLALACLHPRAGTPCSD